MQWKESQESLKPWNKLRKHITGIAKTAILRNTIINYNFFFFSVCEFRKYTRYLRQTCIDEPNKGEFPILSITVYSKASRYTASSYTDLDNARFWIGSKKIWDAQIYVVETLNCTLGFLMILLLPY